MNQNRLGTVRQCLAAIVLSVGLLGQAGLARAAQYCGDAGIGNCPSEATVDGCPTQTYAPGQPCCWQYTASSEYCETDCACSTMGSACTTSEALKLQICSQPHGDGNNFDIGTACSVGPDCISGACQGGVCVEQPGFYCNANSQCGSDCCVSDTCTPTSSISNGEPCCADSQCSSGYCKSGSCTNAADAGGACTGDSKSCQTGLECESSTCCIPSGSSEYECSSGGCCKTPDGGTIACNGSGICCNGVSGACYAASDCCVGNTCLDGLCVIDVNQGFCYEDAGCASDLCSSTNNTCTCLATGFLGPQAQDPNSCCSGSSIYTCALYIFPSCRAYAWECQTNPTLDTVCTSNSGCDSLTQSCVDDTCVLTSAGSVYEPCPDAGYCSQSPVALGCSSTGQCCNSIDGGCLTDQDCCVYSSCNGVDGGQGECKADKGIGCTANSQCLFGLCDGGHCL